MLICTLQSATEFLKRLVTRILRERNVFEDKSTTKRNLDFVNSNYYFLIIHLSKYTYRKTNFQKTHTAVFVQS